MKIEPTHSENHTMGFKKDFDKGLCEYWYSEDTYVEMKRINILRESKHSAYRKLGGGESLPIHIDKDTKEITVDGGVINLMIQ